MSVNTDKNKLYDEIESHEDRHRKGRHRVTSAAEDKLIRVYQPHKSAIHCTSEVISAV
jgi:hypothetical protein